MRTERLLVDTIVTLLAAVVLFGIGAAIAPWVVRTSVDTIGLAEVAFASPDEPFWAYVWLAVGTALPAPFAWLVGATYRVSARRAPPVPLLVAVVLVVLVAAAGGLAFAVWAWRTMLAVPTSITPIVTIAGLELGPTMIRFGLRATLVLAGIAFFAGRRARREPGGG